MKHHSGVTLAQHANEDGSLRLSVVVGNLIGKDCFTRAWPSLEDVNATPKESAAEHGIQPGHAAVQTNNARLVGSVIHHAHAASSSGVTACNITVKVEPLPS